MAAEVVFIDRRIGDYQGFVDRLAANATVFFLEAGRDGVWDMAAFLADRGDIDTIRILAHGAPAAVQLGAAVLQPATLAAYREPLAAIGRSLSTDGDLVLYGCDVAAGELGRSFVDALSAATGADVLASSNATGLGGDWQLEYAAGPIEAASIVPTAPLATLAIVPDSGFSTDGKLSTDVGVFDNGRAMVVQGDGKIVVTGFTGSGLSDTDIVLLRYQADGSLDSSFSGDGKLVTDFGWSTHGEAVALQKDGKIVVAGGSVTAGGEFDFALARYLANGTLDSSFSGDGKLTTDLGSDDTAYALQIQSDGKIVVAGESVAGVGLARYNADGTLDTTFSADGKVVVGAPPMSAYLGSAMTLQTDGKILVAGYYNHTEFSMVPPYTPKTYFDFALMRFTSSGALDSGFGNGGIVVTDMGNDFDEAGGVIVQADGKILVSGHAGDSFALARYNANGALDSTFGGGDGKVSTALGSGATGFAVALQADGKILVAGTTSAGATIVRYTAGGVLDSTFDGDGIYGVGFGGLSASGNALAVLPGGEILLAGTNWLTMSSSDFALARLKDSSAGTTITGTANADNLVGGAGNDTVSGLAGNDTLNGGAGSDLLLGGTGDDLYTVDDIGDIVTESSSSGNDTVLSNLVAYTLPGNVENGRILSSAAANLTGNGLGNVLYAGVGNNVLNGGAGTDTVSYAYGVAGGSGVKVSLALATAQTTVGSGTDTLISIENLTGSAYADTLTGNDGNNRILGAEGADTLNGGLGNDTMAGGDGNDQYTVDSTGDVVTESSSAAGGTDIVYSTATAYTLGAYVENARVNTSKAANLTGNSLNNLFFAGIGDNVLDGGGGVDTVSYAFGFVTGYGVTVNLTLDTAQITTGSGTDTLLGIENLFGTTYADNFTGDDANNRLVGNNGNDTLDGGLGNDTLIGGDGNDLYTVNSSADVVTETNATASTGGTDTVYSTASAYTLGANIENGRIATTAAAGLTGNLLNNLLYAGAGNNALNGSAGIDTVSYAYGVAGGHGVTVDLALTSAQATGGSGSDMLIGIERLIGSSYGDQLTGNSSANQLNGAAGNDTLFGGDGGDTLIGSAGQDLLSGGNGYDVFDFNALSEMGSSTTTCDTISDFAVGDHIDLSTLDAWITSPSSNEAFTFIGTAVFSSVNATGQLRYAIDAVNGVRYVYGSTDADSAAEFVIKLLGVGALNGADFAL